MQFLSFALVATVCRWVKTSATEQFVEETNWFTSAVYNITGAKEGNILVSPLSAEILLALVQSGAKNQTAEEIQTCLHWSSKINVSTLFSRLNGELYTLKIANKIYINNNFTINPQFVKTASEIYKAEAQNLDFAQKTAADTINKWAEKQTENKIRNLMSSDNLNRATSLVLINALYFKGSWVHSFNKYSTKKSKFYKTAKNVVQVDTMYINGRKFGYYESSDLKARFLELKFKGENVAMIIALPTEIEGLSSLERQAEKVFTFRKFDCSFVDIALPKFKIETKTDFEDILKKLGINKAFSPDEADFSGIAGYRGDLFINQIVQKTYIDVNEDGVEAAAATFIGVPRTLLLHKSAPKKFIVDHPFIFFIKIRNIVVFVGRITNPS